MPKQNMIKLPDSPEKFLKLIPTNVQENVLFRQKLHAILAKDEGFRQTFVAMCREKQQITFKTMLWTFQTKREQSVHKHLPFITWPVQDELIDKLIYSIRYGGDLLVDKSREMGATWIVLGAFFVEWLFVPDTTLLVTSRKEEYVWKRGNPDTLYWKLEYLYRNLPLWASPKIDLSERHLLNIENYSVIDGESTNADVGAGGRRQAVMCDEFSRVNPADAASIAETLSDTTPARIFNSTPTSRGHPFGQIRFSGKVEIYTMPWWRHPWKIRGYYESPRMDRIIIYDIDYYRKLAPNVFGTIKAGVEIKYSNLEKDLLFTYSDDPVVSEIKFIADGNDIANDQYHSPSGKRSPWYDGECRRRSKRDKATNIDINYVGSGDMVFNSSTLQRSLNTVVKDPVLTGEVAYDVIRNKVMSVRFLPEAGARRLLWWTPLGGSRPMQTHNYIIGCDIAFGTGDSFSVASVYDVDTNEKVGRWRCAHTSPTHFAEQVYALGKWIGGATGWPFLIWEANGPGQIMDKRLYELGYSFVYMTTEEKRPTRKRKKTRGWFSSSDNKLAVLLRYDAALESQFRVGMEEDKFINYDKMSLHEAEDYVFYMDKAGIGPSKSEGDRGAAKAGHGDIVIADSLCCLARLDQRAASLHFAPSIYQGSFAARRQIRERADKKGKEAVKWLR